MPKHWGWQIRLKISDCTVYICTCGTEKQRWWWDPVPEASCSHDAASRHPGPLRRRRWGQEVLLQGAVLGVYVHQEMLHTSTHHGLSGYVRVGQSRRAMECRSYRVTVSCTCSYKRRPLTPPDNVARLVPMHNARTHRRMDTLLRNHKNMFHRRHLGPCCHLVLSACSQHQRGPAALPT
jgi:hypothetical protein